MSELQTGGFGALVTECMGPSDISIKEIKYVKQLKQLQLFFETDGTVEPESRDKLLRKVRTDLPPVEDIKIYVSFNWPKEDVNQVVERYWPTVVWMTSKICPGLNGMLKVMRPELTTGTLEIHLPDEFSIRQLRQKNCEKLISQQIHKELDLSLGVELVYDHAGHEKSLVEFEENKVTKARQAMETAKVERQKNLAEQGSKPAPSNGGGGGGFNGGGGGGFSKKSPKEKPAHVIYRREIKRPPVPIKGNMEEESVVCFEGKIFEQDVRELRSGKKLISFAITDYSYSINCKIFAKPEEAEELEGKLNKGVWYKVEGNIRYDSFEKELMMFVMNINEGKIEEQRMDTYTGQKRVELHMHTNMSDMDGVASVKDLVGTAARWGHKAIAITDHGVLQAFPDGMHASDGKDIKVLYGVEGYLFNDDAEVIKKTNDEDLNQTFIVFDLETTGLSFKHDMITEIGAVKVMNGEIIDSYSALVNPGRPIPSKIVEITGITDDMVADKPPIERVLPQFLEFIGDSAVVAHNASFDVSFVKKQAEDMGREFDPVVLDTLTLARLLLKDLKRHKLNQVAKYLKIKLDNHHRAVDDAMATAKIFCRFISMLADLEITDMAGINELGLKELDYKSADIYHVIILVKNQAGLKNLYKMVSHSNTQTFYRRPRIPKSLLSKYREDFIIGSACEAGELFKAILSNKSQEEIEKVAQYYDYLEIQPIGNNEFMIPKGIAQDKEELRGHMRQIVALGEKLNIPVAATGDVHFLNPEDEVYRRIIMAGKGFADADNQPPLYLRTTEDMLNEFKYLGAEKAKEVVIDVPNTIADSIDEILPIPKETYPPRIEGSDDELREMCFVKARSIYGDDLPEVVEERLEKELNSIISNGYSVMYIIAQKLVVKSLEDGYLVGSRGSVGSSFAATMSDITEVNPLPPHYVCKNCKHSTFIMDGSCGSGADLPDRDCPECGTAYTKDGHDIPFATFLGFDGDKEPDIDLNFAGVYQATSHKYTEELFGTGYVYKAGTIGTIADKTAFGYVKKYFEERGMDNVNSKEIIRLSQGCTGIKRTSGQHPGGIMVIPDYKEASDFTPIQYPANDVNCGVLTTHFDYHSISGRILKLDILGHDVPTIIRQLEDITGVNIFDVPLDDAQTVKIFTSIDTLNILDKDYPLDIGSLGIPEFGTRFVRQMLVDTQPSTFADLVRISGLSHGTDVWLNNAQDLVRNGTVEIKDVISTRDDIMVYLMYQGLPPIQAFVIMEKVRKGKGLTDEDIELMKENNVPEWYIWSCNQIKYMFPKAHAVAYVMMSFRIAYFKVHHPLAFYATHYGIKVDDFDAQLVCQGKAAIQSKLTEMDGMEMNLSKKEQDLYTILEIVREMYARGLEFHKIDLYKSHATEFKIVDEKLLPPFQALQGVGENAARSLVEAVKMGEILSIQDLRTKSKVSKTVIEALRDHGCLEGLPEDNQLSLFGF